MNKLIIFSGPTDRINAPKEQQSLSNPLAFQGGSYDSILEVLWFLTELGVTAIHLSCPFQQVRAQLDPWTGLINSFSHGFCPQNFKTLNVEFGTLADLKRFIRGCGEARIKVIGELTFHFGPDASFKEGWTTPREDWCMGILPRLNLKNPQVRTYILETVDWFADQGFYGIRLDTAFELPQEFLNVVVTSAQRRNLFLIGEVFVGDPDQIQCLPQGVHWTDYPLSFSLFEVIAGRSDVTQLHQLMTHPYSQGLLATFVDNHDVASLVRECVKRSGNPAQAIKFARARLLMALTILMVVRGVPTIYYLDPWALSVEGMADPLGTNRLPTPWQQRPVFQLAISKLTHLRQTRSELANGTYRELWLPGSKNVWVFAKTNKRTIVVLVNNEDHHVKLDDLGGIDAQGLLVDGKHTCMLRPGKHFLVEDNRISGKLAPRSVYLLGS